MAYPRDVILWIVWPGYCVGSISMCTEIITTAEMTAITSLHQWRFREHNEESNCMYLDIFFKIFNSYQGVGFNNGILDLIMYYRWWAPFDPSITISSKLFDPWKESHIQFYCRFPALWWWHRSLCLKSSTGHTRAVSPSQCQCQECSNR